MMPSAANTAVEKSFFSRMKAEIAVRSISASISACAARIAPRTISRVTGSQMSAGELRVSTSVKGGIRAVLQEEQCHGADDGGKDQEERRRHRVLGRVD